MTIPETATIVLQQGGGGGGIVFLLALLALVVANFVGMWKIFTKANQPGWAAIIPIYNVYILLKVGNNAWWWLLVMPVPLVGLYGMYKMAAGVSNAFGQGIGFTLGLLFLGFIFTPLLGFGDYTYQEPPA